MQRELFVLLLAVALIGAIGWVSRNPVATKWYGPFPSETELRSLYYRRKTLFALRCLAIVGLAASVVWAIALVVPEFRGSQGLVLIGLHLTFFGGMAIVGAMLAAFASFKAFVFGPNPILRTQWEQARLEGEPKA